MREKDTERERTSRERMRCRENVCERKRDRELKRVKREMQTDRI